VTRVYADMVADLFHHGHVELLRRARELGDELIVGVHSDDTVASYKRRPLMTMDERVRVVGACRHVDEVVPDAPLELSRAYIELHRIDLVVHGDDLSAENMQRMFGVPREMGILRLIPYTPSISTSDIMRRLEQRLRDEARESDLPVRSVRRRR
jgi:cytidyltransferase-like protein